MFRDIILTIPQPIVNDSVFHCDIQGVYQSNWYKPGFVEMNNYEAAKQCSNEGGHLSISGNH